MQADWEIEIGADAPVIDADWPGLIDLQLHPERARSLEEGRRFPPLAAALIVLNRAGFPLRTSKCDVWEPRDLDPDELDAPHQRNLCALACYIDLLPREAGFWSGIDAVVEWCKACCCRLRDLPLISSRVDLIVRGAVYASQEDALGVTAYLVACAPTRPEAEAHLERVVDVFAQAVTSPPVSRPVPQG